MTLIIDSPRGNAVYRIVFILAISWWLLPLLFTVTVIAALVWMVVDVTITLVSGGDGLSAGGGMSPTGLTRGLVYWPVRMGEWAVFGTPDFPWTPMAATA